MSKLFDIAAIVLIAASAVSAQAGVSDADKTTTASHHRLCILNDASSTAGSIQLDIYTATTDFNMVHSDMLIQEQSQTDEFQTLSIVNSMPQLLEQPDALPSAFIERLNF